MKKYDYFKWDKKTPINRATPEQVVEAFHLQEDEDVYFITLDNVPFQHLIGISEEDVMKRILEIQEQDNMQENSTV